MEQIIQWKLDICGEEPEMFDGGKPVGAVPQAAGNLARGYLRWSYKKGERTRVEVLANENCREYWFLDIQRGHEISGISHEAFRFVD